MVGLCRNGLHLRQRHFLAFTQGYVEPAVGEAAENAAAEDGRRNRGGKSHEDHHAEWDGEEARHGQGPGRGGDQGVGGDAARADGHQVQDVVLLGADPKGLGQRHQQVENGVEEDRHRQDRAGAEESQGGPALAEQADKGARDPIRRAAFQEALADDRRHADDDSDLPARRAEGLADRLRCPGAGRAQDADQEGGHDQGEEGVKPKRIRYKPISR